MNTLGSFQCRCEDGYSVKPDGGPSCTDEDECYLGSYNCHTYADCINNPVNMTIINSDFFYRIGIYRDLTNADVRMDSLETV